MLYKGEKLGWTIGWIGGSCFLFIGAVLWLVSGNLRAGCVAMVCYILLIFFTLKLSPWKYPDTPYWKLLLPSYICLVPGIIILFFIGFPGEDLSGQWHNLLFLLPMMTPFLTMGRRTWNNSVATVKPKTD
ncbi:MAG TPA: hypothetical protein PLP19_21180 [bacterium]|nr:hypothetical protein [bacterium]HPN46011.1 hypothetical protein [bacterium]